MLRKMDTSKYALSDYVRFLKQRRTSDLNNNLYLASSHTTYLMLYSLGVLQLPMECDITSHWNADTLLKSHLSVCLSVTLVTQSCLYGSMPNVHDAIASYFLWHHSMLLSKSL